MNKFRSRLYLLILAGVTLLFSIIMAILLDRTMPLVDDEAKLIYYITKGVASLALIGITFYAIFFRKDPANLAILFIFTAIYQLLPLLIRFLVTREDPLILWSVTILFFVSIIYLGLLFSFDLLNTKVKKAKIELEGKTIPVIDEDSYYDDDGKFVSATSKDKAQ